MKQEFLRWLHQFAFILPFPWLLRATGQRFFLPFYHAMQGETPLPHIQHLYQIRSAQQFEADLDFFLRYYRPIGLEELYDAFIQDKVIPENAFFLSFDDGLKEVYDIAAPILMRKGIPATIFINSAFVDNQALFYRYKVSLLLNALEQKSLSPATEVALKEQFARFELYHKSIKTNLLSVRFHQRAVLDKIAQMMDLDFSDFLRQYQPYLNRQQLAELAQEGFSIGGHSVDHPLYQELTLEQQLRQTQDSITYIEDHFAPRVRSFAFPFSDDGVSQRFFNELVQNQIADITFGCAGLKADSAPHHLHRYPMERHGFEAHSLVAAEYFYYIVKAIFRKNTIQR